MPGKDRWPSGKEKTRVVFILMEDGAESGSSVHMMETPGWIEDENALKSALARAVKLEGLADTWEEIGEMCQTAQFEWATSEETGRAVTRAYLVAI